MIEKTTTNQNYPKPDENNSLQDDVANIENALDMIDPPPIPIAIPTEDMKKVMGITTVTAAIPSGPT